MEAFLSNQVNGIIELIVDDDKKKPLFARVLNTTANAIFMIVILCLLIKSGLLFKDYAMREWIGENSVWKGALETFLKSTMVFVFVGAFFLLLTRLLLLLKNVLKLFQIVLIIGSVKLVIELIEILKSDNIADVGTFAFGLFT